MRTTQKPRTVRRAPVTPAARIDKVGRSGVHPISGPHFSGNAPMVWPGAWGQGKRGGAGYEDHGESELDVVRVTPEKCRDIMTKDPAFCQAGDTILIAAKIMKKHGVGALPVVETIREPKLAGMVTDRDLVMRVLAAGRDPRETILRDIMSKPVISCSPDDDYQTALTLMERHQIKRIPAIDNAGHVVGMISQADVALRVPDRSKIADVVAAISQPV